MTYADRVQELEAEGLTTSDAQSVADAETIPHDPLCGLEGVPCPTCAAEEEQHFSPMARRVTVNKRAGLRTAWEF